MGGAVLDEIAAQVVDDVVPVAVGPAVDPAVDPAADHGAPDGWRLRVLVGLGRWFHARRVPGSTAYRRECEAVSAWSARAGCSRSATTTRTDDTSASPSVLTTRDLRRERR